MIYLTRKKPQTIVSITYFLLRDYSMHLESGDIKFQLPNCTYKFHKQSFIVTFLFRFFLKYFFWIGFSLFYIAINFAFILCTATYCDVL